MKLFYCESCHDVVSLDHDLRKCKCGKSEGQYKGSLKAKLSGDCIPIGFSNGSFISALQNQPESGMGKIFEAFVIPESCDTISYY